MGAPQQDVKGLPADAALLHLIICPVCPGQLRTDTHELREEAKVAFFAWLYGSKQAANTSTANLLETFYEKGSLLDKYWKDNNITTPYGKTIPEVTRHHALNYLVQSTAAELTLKQALREAYGRNSF